LSAIANRLFLCYNFPETRAENQTLRTVFLLNIDAGGDPMKKILWLTFSVIVLFVSFAIFRLMDFFSVSQGERVDVSTDINGALLVMDIQKDFTRPSEGGPAKIKNATELIERLNVITRKAKTAGLKVVYIKTEYERNDHILNMIRKNVAITGTSGTDFDPRLNLVSNEVFSKKRMDALSNPALERFFRANNIGRVYIAGLDAGYCVKKTALAALNRGMKVVLVVDALATGTGAEVSACIDEAVKSGAETITSEGFPR